MSEKGPKFTAGGKTNKELQDAYLAEMSQECARCGYPKAAHFKAADTGVFGVSLGPVGFVCPDVCFTPKPAKKAKKK